MSLIVWLYDDPSGTYHSAACRCDQHCREGIARQLRHIVRSALAAEES